MWTRFFLSFSLRSFFISVALLLFAYITSFIYSNATKQTATEKTHSDFAWLDAMSVVHLSFKNERNTEMHIVKLAIQAIQRIIYMQMSATYYIASTENQPHHSKCRKWTNARNESKKWEICKSLNFGGQQNFDIYWSKLKGIELHDFFKNSSSSTINNTHELYYLFNIKYNIDVVSKRNK